MKFKIYTTAKVNPWSSIPDSARSLFVHVPKTGGTSIVRALGLAPTWHPRVEEYYAHDPGRAERLFKYAFVRNPWDRIVSSFHYMLQRDDSQVEVDWRNKWLANCDSFASFIERLESEFVFRNVVLSHAMFQPQTKFLFHRNQIGVDYIGRYEQIDTDFEKICAEIGVTEVSLGTSNKSARVDYREYYSSKKHIETVRYIYKSDISNLGYSFLDS